MTSEIRANKQTNRVGLGTVEYTNTGIIVSGIVTCTELSGLTALNIAGVGTANTLDINGDIDVDGHTNLDNVSIAGVTTTGAVSWGGHMLPTSNAAYDIGSADYKVRHLFLSDNSLKFVDSSDTEHPLSVDSGRLKFAGGLLLGSSIKADAVSGIITATSFVGSGANLTGITGTTINNNADNRIITGSGTANTLEGESTLTYDGTNLDLSDDKKIRIGTGNDLNIYHQNSDNNSYVKIDNGTLIIHTSGASNGVLVKNQGGTELWVIKGGGNIEPGFNNFFSIGDTGKQVNNIYTNNLIAGGTVTIADTIVHSGDTNTKIRFPAADTFSVETAGSERLRIKSDGKIDIGGSTRTGNAARLTVTHTNNSGVGLIDIDSYGSATLQIRSNWSGGTINGMPNQTFGIGTPHQYPLVFTTHGTERLRITSDGVINCGHGSAINLHGSTTTGINLNANTNSGQILANASGNRALIIGRQGSYGQVIEFFQGTNTNEAGISIPAADTLGFETNGTERLRITSDGKLLIGTSNTNNAFSGGDDLIIGNTDSGTRSGITLVSATDQDGGLYFSDGTSSGSSNVQGQVVYDHSNHYLRLYVAANEKVRILGNTTDNVLQIRGGNNLSISDYAPNQTFSGTYTGYHTDNHGNTIIGLNAHLHYSSNSGTHQWKQTNAHSTIGSAGMFIGGNGSNNNSDITFFRNGQGSSAGTVFAQDSWKFQIGSDIRQNFNQRYLQRGFFKTDTSNQTASNFPLAAGSGVGGYSFGYQEAYSTSNGTWVHPYPNLVLAYHTGMQFGAYRNYGGCRFYQDHPSGNTSTVLEIGNNSTGVHVTNSFTAGSNKGFRIAHPHPSKKYTHDLVHNAIEAPQMDLIYRGKVDLVAGSATVNIDTKAGMTDGTFVLLNRDIQCFTSNETGWTVVKGSVSGNILTITAQDNSCTDTISWMVVGERQDDKIKESELTTEDGDLIVEPVTIEATHM